jgi:hypothetical protein
LPSFGAENIFSFCATAEIQKSCPIDFAHCHVAAPGRAGAPGARGHAYFWRLTALAFIVLCDLWPMCGMQDSVNLFLSIGC